MAKNIIKDMTQEKAQEYLEHMRRMALKEMGDREQVLRQVTGTEKAPDEEYSVADPRRLHQFLPFELNPFMYMWALSLFKLSYCSSRSKIARDLTAAFLKTVNPDSASRDEFIEAAAESREWGFLIGGCYLEMVAQYLVDHVCPNRLMLACFLGQPLMPDQEDDELWLVKEVRAHIAKIAGQTGKGRLNLSMDLTTELIRQFDHAVESGFWEKVQRRVEEIQSEHASEVQAEGVD